MIFGVGARGFGRGQNDHDAPPFAAVFVDGELPDDGTVYLNIGTKERHFACLAQRRIQRGDCGIRRINRNADIGKTGAHRIPDFQKARGPVIGRGKPLHRGDLVGSVRIIGKMVIGYKGMKAVLKHIA